MWGGGGCCAARMVHRRGVKGIDEFKGEELVAEKMQQKWQWQNSSSS